MRGHVAAQNEGYRRGMVLGLTMAEIMFLLVFVLLLIMTGVLKSMKDQVIDLRTANAELNHKLAEKQEFVDAAKELKDLGVDKEVLQTAVTLIREVSEAVKSKNSADLVEVLRKIRNQLKVAPPKIPEDWQKLVRMKETVEKLGGVELIAQQLNELKVLREEAKAKGKNDLPPLIRLSEADGFHFQLGKSELTPEFEAFLREKVIPLLVQRKQDYDVDVIEVVGHTDLVPMTGLQASNLDMKLRDSLRGAGPVAALVPADNAGLGMSRSVAVARILLDDPRLKDLKIIPLSAAQLVDLDENLDTEAGDSTSANEKRRRIEIRLRRSSKTQTLTPE